MLKRRRHETERSAGGPGYFRLLNDLATILAATAQDVAGLFERPLRSEGDLVAVRERGERSVRLHSQLSTRIATSYMVPFHREDLNALAGGVRNVTDDLGHAAELVVLLQPDVIPDQLVAHARVVSEAAHQTVTLVSQLPVGRVDIALAEIDRLEGRGDIIFRQTLGWLFSGAHDDLDVIRWKDILEAMEDALNGIEKVGDVVEGMVIRHG